MKVVLDRTVHISVTSYRLLKKLAIKEKISLKKAADKTLKQALK